MSVYGFHEANIDYMACRGCNTKAFAWLADVAVCPECGAHDYAEPEELEDIETENTSARKDIEEKREDSKSRGNGKIEVKKITMEGDTVDEAQANSKVEADQKSKVGKTGKERARMLSKVKEEMDTE